MNNRKVLEMRALPLIAKTREYLDYVERHIRNVERAFIELKDKSRNEWWASDEYYFQLCTEVEWHDYSKLSAAEFTAYRDKFYGVPGDVTPRVSDFAFLSAWEHHKAHNTHHHETVKTDIDVVHMVLDWQAMGYEFGDTAEQYYEKNKDRIHLSDDHKAVMFSVFEVLRRSI